MIPVAPKEKKNASGTQGSLSTVKVRVLVLCWGRRSLIDHICCNFCIVLSMFLRLVLANPLFSLRNINLTLGLLPPRRHVMAWFCGCWELGLKSECADILHQSFSGCYTVLKSYNNSETAVYGYSPALFWVLWCRVDECRVNFHVVRSALQYFACRILNVSTCYFIDPTFFGRFVCCPVQSFVVYVCT